MSETTAKLAEVIGWPSVIEMCRSLSISINRGYALVWAGRIAAQKIGGQWRVSPRAIERYSAEREARRARRD